MYCSAKFNRKLFTRNTHSILMLSAGTTKMKASLFFAVFCCFVLIEVSDGQNSAGCRTLVIGGENIDCSKPVQAIYEKELILSALEAFHRYTCIRVEPKKPSDGKYFVRIHKNTNTSHGDCYSLIGRDRRETHQPQNVSLQTGCLIPGRVQHEIMHALGFWHEHTRPDRDNYVTVFFENILDRPTSKNPPRNNFLKFGWRSPLLKGKKEYDFASVLHYSDKAFTKNGKRTIVSKDPKYQNIMGQRKYLSILDIKELNLYYECGDMSPKFPAPIDKPDPNNPTACTFDDSFCGFTQDHPVRIGPNLDPDPAVDQYNDQLDWLRVDSVSNIIKTRHDTRVVWAERGPRNDFSGNGRFLFFDSKNPAADLKDNARIRSPFYQTGNESDFCITFWYHIEHFGKLNVLIVSKKLGNLPAVIWSKEVLPKDSKPVTWKFARIPAKVTGQDDNIQVIFEAEVIISINMSDIAIDNYAIVKGECSAGLG